MNIGDTKRVRLSKLLMDEYQRVMGICLLIEKAFYINTLLALA